MRNFKGKMYRRVTHHNITTIMEDDDITFSNLQSLINSYDFTGVQEENVQEGATRFSAPESRPATLSTQTSRPTAPAAPDSFNKNKSTNCSCSLIKSSSYSFNTSKSTNCSCSPRKSASFSFNQNKSTYCSCTLSKSARYSLDKISLEPKKF